MGLHCMGCTSGAMLMKLHSMDYKTPSCKQIFTLLGTCIMVFIISTIFIFFEMSIMMMCINIFCRPWALQTNGSNNEINLHRVLRVQNN